MEWLANNWILIVAVLGMLALHWFGHGGHGRGHGRHSQGRDRRDSEPPGEGAELPAATGAAAHAGHGDAPSPEGRRRHRHGC